MQKVTDNQRRERREARLRLLAFGGALDTENIGAFSELETLNIGTLKGDMTPFGTLKKLKIFCVEDLHARSLAGLEGCEQLERIRIQTNQLADISALAGMKKLKIFEARSPQIEDISALTGCPLEKLNLSETATLDFSPLETLTELRELSLGSTFFEDASVLSGLRNLRKVKLSDTLIIDLHPLAELHELTELDISECNAVKDISPLYGLKNLEQLRLPAAILKRARQDSSVPDAIKAIITG